MEGDLGAVREPEWVPGVGPVPAIGRTEPRAWHGFCRRENGGTCVTPQSPCTARNTKSVRGGKFVSERL